MLFRTAYCDKIVADLVNNEPSMTKQEFQADCDINNILKRYNLQLGLDSMAEYHSFYEGNFEDVSAAVSLQEAYAQVQAAHEAFDAMPSKVRARFRNDPVELLEFLGNAANREEAIALGLLENPKVESAPLST